jgi:hypothetical protein
MVTFTASFVGSNPSFQEKQKKAAELLTQVWNSDEFKQAILENVITACTGMLWWKKCKLVKSFTSTYFSNEGVYEKLMLEKNAHIIQEIVTDGCRNPNVVGYEDGTDVIKVCKGWDEYLDVYGVLDNMAHEWCHHLEFHHSSPKDLESVPYKVGKIAAGIARKLSLSNVA